MILGFAYASFFHFLFFSALFYLCIPLYVNNKESFVWFAKSRFEGKPVSEAYIRTFKFGLNF